LSQEAKNERKKHLQEERFGLPIPDTVLREEEEEENANAGPNGLGTGDVVIGEMNKEQREKARLAFDAVEPRVLEVVEGNMSGLSHYLGECFGFGVLGGW
jgi:chromatin structure-remodeling complex subunit RSC9